MKKAHSLRISPLWKIILFLQAALVAWIGFTHGSGIEIYLQKFSTLSEKTILSWDRNSAGLIAVLALTLIWRPLRPVLFFLAVLYFVETLLLHLSGGTVDQKLPLLAGAVHYLLPLAPFALDGRRWAMAVLQLGLVLSLGNFIMIFLNAAPYYMDALFSLCRHLGLNPSEVQLQGVMLVLSLVLTAALFVSSKKTWAFVVISLFSLWLMTLQLVNFGPGLLPEAFLKLELLAAAAVVWMMRKTRSESRLYF